MKRNVFVCASLSQELKQDISSFRYEVMGMMKMGKPALPGGKAGGSSADCSASLEEPPGPHGSQVKSKLNRFKIIASILKRGTSAPSPRPPEAPNGLPNGVLSTASDKSSCEDLRRNFSKDIADAGLHQWGGIEQSDAGEIPREMYPLSEEAAGSGNSDAKAEDREQEKAGERLPEIQTAADKQLGENAFRSSDEGGTEETEKSLPCGDWDAAVSGLDEVQDQKRPRSVRLKAEREWRCGFWSDNQIWSLETQGGLQLRVFHFCYISRNDAAQINRA